MITLCPSSILSISDLWADQIREGRGGLPSATRKQFFGYVLSGPHLFTLKNKQFYSTVSALLKVFEYSMLNMEETK